MFSFSDCGIFCKNIVCRKKSTFVLQGLEHPDDVCLLLQKIQNYHQSLIPPFILPIWVPHVDIQTVTFYYPWFL